MPTGPEEMGYVPEEAESFVAIDSREVKKPAGASFTETTNEPTMENGTVETQRNPESKEKLEIRRFLEKLTKTPKKYFDPKKIAAGLMVVGMLINMSILSGCEKPIKFGDSLPERPVATELAKIHHEVDGHRLDLEQAEVHLSKFESGGYFLADRSEKSEGTKIVYESDKKEFNATELGVMAVKELVTTLEKNGYQVANSSAAGTAKTRASNGGYFDDCVSYRKSFDETAKWKSETSKLDYSFKTSENYPNYLELTLGVKAPSKVLGEGYNTINADEDHNITSTEQEALGLELARVLAESSIKATDGIVVGESSEPNKSYLYEIDGYQIDKAIKLYLGKMNAEENHVTTEYTIGIIKVEK